MPLETQALGGDPMTLATAALGLGVVLGVLAFAGRARFPEPVKWLRMGAIIALVCGTASLLAVVSGAIPLALLLGALGLSMAVVLVFPAIGAALKSTGAPRR
ncbi:MAG TPA: hypothetical protein GXZ45_13480 [Propionibacterium sp.]|nr:hypothetical protein [Propionibacterium sp.]